MFLGNITAFGTPLFRVGLRSRFGGSLQQQCFFYSVGCPTILPVESLGTGGIHQCGSVPSSAGSGFSAGVVGWRIAAL